MMVATQELDAADVTEMCGSDVPADAPPPESTEGLRVIEDASAAVADVEAKDGSEVSLVRDALVWSTRITSDAVISGLIAELPVAVKEEQVRKYLDREARPAKRRPTFVVIPNLMASRMQTARAFNTFIEESGWRAGDRLPHGCVPNFIKGLRWTGKMTIKHKGVALRRWHDVWIKTRSRANPQLRGEKAPRGVRVYVTSAARVRRSSLKVAHYKVPWVRQALFEWFASVRYAVDWTALAKGVAPQSRRKAIGRFTRSLVRSKALELLQVYAREKLMRGIATNGVQFNSTWFRGWEAEYGLAMKAPNRKFKVSREVMAERLCIGWENVYRLRAFVLEHKKYDPEMENWDQTPLHNNEGGSQNRRTLAVAGRGTTVPIVEDVGATRSRWTANLTTFSNAARIRDHGPPYTEFVFKASGERMQAKLREHLRSSGAPNWVTVQTSEKGSYRTPDVLNFLSSHLPPMTEERQWRLLFADDHRPHLSDNVRRLAWSRGYIMMVWGGGVTAVQQTCDTDLNQAVKRFYEEKETAELMSQFRAGKVVPKITPEKAMDMMIGVLRNTQLHLDAASGYLKVGLTAALSDSSLDAQIVREAKKFWDELGMRKRINSAVADVQKEVREGRLPWSETSVRRLIMPYPKHKHIDKVLEMMDDDTWLQDGDCPYAEEHEGDESADSDKGWGTDDDNDDDDDDKPDAAAVVPDAAAVAPEHEEISVSEEVAESVQQSTAVIAALQSAMQTLKDAGQLSTVAHLQSQVNKEERKLRLRSSEDQEVQRALQQHKDREEAAALKRKEVIAADNRLTMNSNKARKYLVNAKEELRILRKATADMESVAETRTAVKTFDPKKLQGDGKPRGEAVAKKMRFEILDRLARLGTGLSASQRNDYAWWRDAWDSAMLTQHGVAWGEKFATWVEKILKDIAGGKANAFSKFVHDETVRCFHDDLVLMVP